MGYVQLGSTFPPFIPDVTVPPSSSGSISILPKVTINPQLNVTSQVNQQAATAAVWAGLKSPVAILALLIGVVAMLKRKK